MKTLAYILSGLPFVMIFTFFIRVFVPYLFLLIPKVVAQNTSLYLTTMGVMGMVLGWFYDAPLAVLMGFIGSCVFGTYFWRCTRGHRQLEDAFGEDWLSRLKSEQKKLLLKKRRGWYLRPALPPGARWERDVSFWTIQGREDPLLCDLWLPSEETQSGLALVFLHGSAWAVGDKDFGTRPFFRHLVTQGHVVMDIGYRLCPEVDIFGMVGDAKRAVAWIKSNAEKYGVDPKKIVMAGASAGGHVALMAAYTPGHPKFSPEDIGEADPAVCGMVSFYGTTDLVLGYEIYRVRQMSKKIPKVPIGTKINHKNFNEGGRYGGRPDIFLGGTPDEVPEMYQLANPTTHVNATSPPTLLAVGENDFLTPRSTTKALYDKLRESGVPALKLTYPWTEHAFDLFLPQTSPSTRSAWYDLGRFLALLAN